MMGHLFVERIFFLFLIFSSSVVLKLYWEIVDNWIVELNI